MTSSAADAEGLAPAAGGSGGSGRDPVDGDASGTAAQAESQPASPSAQPDLSRTLGGERTPAQPEKQPDLPQQLQETLSQTEKQPDLPQQLQETPAQPEKQPDLPQQLQETLSQPEKQPELPQQLQERQECRQPSPQPTKQPPKAQVQPQPPLQLWQHMNLKQRLHSDAKFRAYGAFVLSGSPLLVELLGLAGYGFLVVDLEHSPAGPAQALAMLQAAAAAQTPVLLRVTANTPELIKKALDLGPAGVVVPLVDGVEDARAAAASCRYPPAGIRGVAYPLVRASGWGTDADYLRTNDSRHLLLCQVESRNAVESVDGILDVKGVDGIFVGPLDLSASLGHIGDTNHPQVLRALRTVEKAAARRPAKVLAGFAGGRPAGEMFAAGYRLVAGTADVALLRDAARADVAAAASSASSASAPLTSAAPRPPPSKAAPQSAAAAAPPSKAAPSAAKRPRL